MPALAPETLRTLLPHIPLWHALTLPQRQTALSIPNTYQAPFHSFRNLPPELDAALFETNELGLKRPLGSLRSLVAFIQRVSTWDFPQGVDMLKYVQANTTHTQRHAMTGVQIGSHSSLAAGAFVKRISSGAFSRALLESATPQEFIRAMGGWIPDGAEYGPGQHRALRGWLQAATRKGNSTYILDQAILTPLDGSCPPDAVLHLALGYGLALPGLMETLLPCLTVIAPGKINVQKPANLEHKPPLTPAGEPLARPFILDDMESWLRALKADPAPVLSDGYNVPMAHIRKVAKGFMALPSFLPGAGFEPDARSLAAISMIYKLNLTTSVGEKRKDWRLGVGPAGEAWLAKSRRDRLADVLGWVPLGLRSKARGGERFGFLGDYALNPFPFAAATETVFEWLDESFATLRAPCDWFAFADSAAEKANPFLEDAENSPELAGRWSTWKEAPEDVYAKLIDQCAGRLASLGALAFAPGPKGSLSVTLAPVGSWLYKQAEAWSLPDSAKAVAVVGGDFTVTLLAPDPGAHMELAPFCEPIGAAFRITKKSIQAAAHNGHTAAAILKTLESYSKHALPANVAYEILAWSGTKKTVRISETILIEGDDPVVMAEIRSAFPKDFAQVSPLALRYLGQGSRAVLGKRLAKKGYFPD